MIEVNCPVCGTLCKIVANPTIHYEPIAHSTLLAECEGLKAKLAKMRKAGSVGKIFEIITRNTIANHWYPSSDNLCADLARVIAQAIAEEVEK